jgi:hypothetical protein
MLSQLLFLRSPPSRVVLFFPLVASLLAISSIAWKSPAGCGSSSGAPIGGHIGIRGYLWVASILLLASTYAVAILIKSRER